MIFIRPNPSLGGVDPMQTYTNYLQTRYNLPAEGQLTDFLTRRDGHLFLDDRLNLNELSDTYGAPLEVVYTPDRKVVV